MVLDPMMVFSAQLLTADTSRGPFSMSAIGTERTFALPLPEVSF